MRVHGRARISQTKPEALGECDFCGFLYNLSDLSWQMDWRGPNLQNLGFLVCPSCKDKPQPNGQRTIILPPDPVSVRNARPRNYAHANNPLSPIGLTLTSNVAAGGFFGTMTGGGGVVAAFDGTINKPAWMCAYSINTSSFNGYVAKNWSPYVGGITTPASLSSPVTPVVVSSFWGYAPNDQSFINNTPIDYVVEGSNNGVSWTTLFSGTTTGTVGEVIGGEPNGGAYTMHRLAFMGDGVSMIAVAQVTFSVSNI